MGNYPGKSKELAELRNERFLELFNQVTLPFYWARFEPQRGQPQTQRILNTARWYQDHNCIVKGHPLCWHTLTADWLLDLSPREILQAQVERIQRDVADFAGVIDMWDVVNEAVIMPIFDRYDNGITRLCKELGRIELIRAMFDTVRSVNPRATLLLNDFDVSPAYDILIEGCLEAGIRIDVDRHPDPHAPGLLGHGAHPESAQAVRTLQPADPLYREYALSQGISCRLKLLT